MDGENKGKPYFLMDDLGETHNFWKHPYRTNIIRENRPFNAPKRKLHRLPFPSIFRWELGMFVSGRAGFHHLLGVWSRSSPNEVLHG